MSRTDKDVPWWVTGALEAEHTADCRAGRRRCDLEGVDHWKPQHFSFRAHLRSGRCYWVPVSERSWADSPPRWFVNHRWSAPDRMAARVACDRARAEHRAGNTPETEPPTRQHRHGATWDWN